MKQYKLGRKKSNREHLAKNLMTSLLAYERVVTTLAKAKLVQSKVERIISTILRTDDLNGYKYALQELGQIKVAKKLIEVTKKQYKDTIGGYTRIINIGNRKGDNARMVILELTKKIEVTVPVKEPAVANMKPSSSSTTTNVINKAPKTKNDKNS